MTYKHGIFDNIDNQYDIIIRKMLTNSNLCKLLYYNSYDPLSEPDFDVNLLVENNIYPYDFAPDVTSEAKSIVNIVLDQFTPIDENSKYCSFIIQFNVIIHNDLVKIANQKLRVFNIMKEIDTLFNGSMEFGVKPLNFYEAVRIRPNVKYGGYATVYVVAEMNQIGK